MKALAVTPGQAETLRVSDVPDVVPQEGEVLIKVVEAGVCGTDSEIAAGLYGESPQGSDYLVVGHESLGEVLEAPRDSGFKKGDFVSSLVRHPDPEPCPACAAGDVGDCMNGGFKERGIKGLHGFMREAYSDMPQNVVRIPTALRDLGVLTEPLSVVEKGITRALRFSSERSPHTRALVIGAGTIGLLSTMLLRLRGYNVVTTDIVEVSGIRPKVVERLGARFEHSGGGSSLRALTEADGYFDLVVEATPSPEAAFAAIAALAPNGTACLLGLSAGDQQIVVPGEKLKSQMVLNNQVVFGSVNANRSSFSAAVKHLAAFSDLWPDACELMISRRLPLDSFNIAVNSDTRTDIKTVIRW